LAFLEATNLAALQTARPDAVMCQQIFKKPSVDIEDVGRYLIGGLNQSFQAINASWILAAF